MTRDLIDFELAIHKVESRHSTRISDRTFQHAANFAQIEDTPCDGYGRSITL